MSCTHKAKSHTNSYVRHAPPHFRAAAISAAACLVCCYSPRLGLCCTSPLTAWHYYLWEWGFSQRTHAHIQQRARDLPHTQARRVWLAGGGGVAGDVRLRNLTTLFILSGKF